MAIYGRLDKVYKTLAGLMPIWTRHRTADMLSWAGLRDDPDMWLGQKMFLALFLGIFGAAMPWTLLKFVGIIEYDPAYLSISQIIAIMSVSLAIQIPIMGVIGVFYYFNLFYVAEERVKRMEKVLPDFLMLMAANISAGMAPFNAFRAAAHDEFGPLAEEVRVVTAKSLGTQSFSEALADLSRAFKSPMLGKTTLLFGKAVKAGGRVAKLLESTATDIRETQELKKELVSSTRTYMIFIIFMIVVAMPMLLVISQQFLVMLLNIQAQTASAQSAGQFGVGFLQGKTSITPQFVQQLAYFIIFEASLLVSLMIGVISEGKMRWGIKYFPLLAIGSVLALSVFRLLLGNLLGSVVGGV